MTRRGKKIILLILALVLLAIAVGGWFFYRYLKNKKTVASQNSTTSSLNPVNSNTGSQFDQKTPTPATTAAPTTPTVNPDTSNQNTAPASTDPYYYSNLGLQQNNNKQYTAAIANFQKAIDLLPTVSDFYSKKAEAEVANGEKDQAIATIGAGLKIIPNDPTLKNKLDILQTVVK